MSLTLFFFSLRDNNIRMRTPQKSYFQPSVSPYIMSPNVIKLKALLRYQNMFKNVGYFATIIMYH